MTGRAGLNADFQSGAASLPASVRQQRVKAGRGLFMKFASLSLAAAMAVATTASFAADLGRAPAAPLAPMPFFLFADTTVGYRIETNAKEPGDYQPGFRAIPIQKQIWNITHVDAWAYGTNFVTIDFLKSNHRDPAAPYASGAVAPNGASGAFEVYGLYRGTLSGNALTSSKTFSVGPVKDLSLEFGFDFNTKNTNFASQKKLLVIGPQIAFDVPGYFTLAALVAKEWGHCGLTPACDPGAFSPIATHEPEFKTNIHFEAAYMQPLSFTGLPLSFKGFTNLITPKGTDGFGSKTKTEFLSSNKLAYDVSSYFGKKNFVELFVGYKYWQNKFGNDHKNPFNTGATEKTLFFGLDWHVL
jgi:hypothetical protein